MLLFIPIAVRALPVGELSGSAHFANVSYDMSKLGNPYENTESPLFQDQSPSPGIYLHWSLPDCFTHGAQDEKTGEVVYRLAPNRWSVTRLWEDSSRHIKSKTFLLESDVLTTEVDLYNAGSPTVPYIGDTDQPYRILGRSFDAAQVPAADSANLDYIRLTTVSQACPFFSAFAPACQNVFGFVDRISQDGISHTSLSYVVCGWYEEHEEKEPYRDYTDLRNLEESMGLTFESPAWPDRTFCHGFIGQIAWETEDTIYHTGTPDDPEPGEIVRLPTIGIGNTSAEALASSLSPSHRGMGHLLHHYLANQENDLDRHFGTAKADKRVHQSHFYAEPVFSVDTFKLPNQGIEKAAFSCLRKLRSLQRVMQMDYGIWLQKQRKVYEYWYLRHYSDSPAYRNLYENKMIEAMAEVKVQYGVLEADYEKVSHLEASLQAGGPSSLQTENDIPFYSPVEPVFMVSQLAANRFVLASYKNSLLACRTREQLIDSLRLDGAPISVELSEKDLTKLSPFLPSLPDTLSGEIRAGIRGCVAEAVFLSGNFPPFLAEAAYEKAGLKPTKEQLDSLSEKIGRMQAARDSHFHGIFPDSRAAGSCHTAWSPLIVEWEINYYPDMDLLSGQPSLKNWSLESGDYQYNKSLSSLLENEYPISGRMFISDTASQQLTALAKRHFATDKELLKGLRQMQHLSQAMSGFNSNFMMRDASVAMDFFSCDQTEQELIRSIQMLAPSTLTERPLFDTLFSPIRAGFFSVSQIRLIDEMGFYQEIANPSVYAGEGMLAPDLRNPVQYIMLPPRLLQPTRLNAFLLDAAGDDIQESFPLAETSPVCGYLVANYLDHSVMAYTREGTYVCSIRLSQTGSSIQIINAPLTPPSPTPPVGLNPQLCKFLEALQEEGAEALQGFLNLINQMQLYIQPSSGVHHTVDYFGRPLALVRAALELEQYGEPEGYRHNQDEGTMDPTHNAQILNLKIPVQVGQLEDPLDGVIGFFEDGDYHHFHCFPHLTAGVADYILDDPQVRLSLHRKPQAPKLLSLLMDPWTEANFVTGILPVSTLKIPQALVSEGLDSLTVTYTSSPVLFDSNLNGLAIPHTDSLDYHWIQSFAHGTYTKKLTCPDGIAAFHGSALHAAEGYVNIQKKPKEDSDN